MSEEIIPIYSIPDLAKSVAAGDFEITTLESAFGAAGQNVLTPHRHNYFELFRIEKGGGSLSVDFDSYEIKPPMILLFSPGRVRDWNPSETPSGFVIRFNAVFFASDTQDTAELSEMHSFYVKPEFKFFCY